MTERRPYQTLEVSRGAIDRAGRLLAEHLAETPAIVDAEVLDAMDILADYRDAHRVALLSTVGVLRDAIGDDVDAVATAYRLKRSRRIVEKLARFRTMSLTAMQDIAAAVPSSLTMPTSGAFAIASLQRPASPFSARTTTTSSHAGLDIERIT